MATYTLAQAAQEAGLDRKLAEHNASRAAQVPPRAAQTKQQYLDGLVSDWPRQFIQEFRNDFRERAAAAIQSASMAELTTIATTLGIDPNPYD